MKENGGVQVALHLFLTSALGMSGQLHLPVVLSSSKRTVFFEYEAVWPQESSGHCEHDNIFRTASITPRLLCRPARWVVPVATVLSCLQA